MGRSTSVGNMLGLREKGKRIIFYCQKRQIDIQSISLIMIVEGTMEEDTAKDQIG